MPRTPKPKRRRMSDAELQHTAKCIAMVVRNAMEDSHAKHLSDAQMAELNQIIRNGIYTALHAMEHSEDAGAKGFMDFTRKMIPTDWESPRLLEDYLTLASDQK